MDIMDKYNILFPDSKCLICDCYVNPIDYVEKSNSLYNCENKCCFYRSYEFFNHINKGTVLSHVHYYSIFGAVFSFSSDSLDEEKEKVLNNIRKRVSYWKENDRYLAEILGRD